eukprot:581338-Hanusia_phi.AAC.11
MALKYQIFRSLLDILSTTWREDEARDDFNQIDVFEVTFGAIWNICTAYDHDCRASGKCADSPHRQVGLSPQSLRTLVHVLAKSMPGTALRHVSVGLLDAVCRSPRSSGHPAGNFALRTQGRQVLTRIHVQILDDPNSDIRVFGIAAFVGE